MSSKNGAIWFWTKLFTSCLKIDHRLSRTRPLIGWFVKTRASFSCPSLILASLTPVAAFVPESVPCLCSASEYRLSCVFGSKIKHKIYAIYNCLSYMYEVSC